MPAVSPAPHRKDGTTWVRMILGLCSLFRPARIPEPKLVTTASVLQTIVQHTNAYVAKKHLWRIEVLPGTCCVHGSLEGLCCD